MKKISILTTIAVLGIAGSALPVQAAENNVFDQLKSNGYAIIGGQVSSLDELKEVLEGAGIQIDNKNCPIFVYPGGNSPETDKPETDNPTPDAPDTGTNPDNPDNSNTPDNPDNSNIPDNSGDNTEEQTFAARIAELVNEERAKAGLGALTPDKEMESAALVRAKEIVTSFSHTRPDGRTFSTVLTDSGFPFRGAGENIAWGQNSPEEVMNAWMNSEGHRANILNPQFTKTGAGHYQNADGRSYWTQLFTY